MDLKVRRKPVIIGVMGSHGDRNRSALEDARRLGREIAKRGYVLLTGGGGGVMKAASEGASAAGGLVIGVLPNERSRPVKGYPNAFVDIPIYTGMGDGRNVINAKTSHVLVALSGGTGTLSEIALALKSGTPVISLHAPKVDVPEGSELYSADTVEGVLTKIGEILEKRDRILSR